MQKVITLSCGSTECILMKNITNGPFDPPGLDGHDSLQVHFWACWTENLLRIMNMWLRRLRNQTTVLFIILKLNSAL